MVIRVVAWFFSVHMVSLETNNVGVPQDTYEEGDCKSLSAISCFNTEREIAYFVTTSMKQWL